MTNSGGGGFNAAIGAVGDAGSVFLDDADAYTISMIADAAKELTEANSIGAATPMQTGPVSGATAANGSLGSVTINKAGLYEISISSSFSSDGNTKIEGAAYMNGVRQGDVSFGRNMSNPNDFGSVAPSNITKILDSDLPAVFTCRFISSVTRILSINHFSLHVLGAGK